MKRVLCIILLTGICAADTITVDAIGHTKDAAIRNALRNAVEQGVGVYLDAETMVDRHTLIRDNILTRTDGYVRTYTVEKTAREFGLFRVTVSAHISKDSLRSDLAAQKLLYEITNRPRIMILLDERIEGEEMFEKTATHKLEEALLERGYTIVEPEQFKKIAQQEKARALDNRALASLAFRQGADLIIRGRISVASPTPKTIYGSRFYTVPVQLNAHIVRADNAEILASHTQRTRKNSRETFSAGQFGLEVGAKLLGDHLIKELNEYWRSEAYSRNEIELTVTGLSSSQLKGLEDGIQAIHFVTDMQLRYLEDESAVYDVRLTGTVQDLRHEIDKNDRSGVAVQGVTAHTLTLQAGTQKPDSIYYTTKPGKLEIAAFEVHDIFPARVRYYSDTALGTVTLRCSDHPVTDLRVGVRIPDVMKLPVEINVDRIEAGAEKRVPLTLVPDQEKVLAFKETRTVNAQVRVTYESSAQQVQRSLTTPVTVHNKNAMDWMKPHAIGGFVTHNAEAVRGLSRVALQAVPGDADRNRDLLNAMVIFESMRRHGISYVKDPTPSGTRLLDAVQYPVETLHMKSGDCDDLSVLYSALLSSVGIPAAIISYHDHVLVMFDTGVYEKNRLSLSADSTKTVVHNATVWIPVETTLLNKGFVEAWHTAADEFHTALAEGQQLSIIELDEAWKHFPPVFPQSQDVDIRLSGLDKAVAAQYAQLQDAARASIAAALQHMKDDTHQPNTAGADATGGILALRQGYYSDAVTHFSRARNAHDTPEMTSNYACALLLDGQDKKARQLLDSTYTQDTSGRVAVNRALCYYVQATDQAGMNAFIDALRTAVDMMPSQHKLAQYLGIDLAQADHSRAAEAHAQQKAQTVNIRRLRELIRSRVLRDYTHAPPRDAGTSNETSHGKSISGTSNETSSGQSADAAPQTVMPFGGIRGADPSQIMKIIDLLYWFE